MRIVSVSKVGGLTPGDRVDVMARPGTKLWFASENSKGWVRAEVTSRDEAGSFRFRTLRREPPIVGTRAMADCGRTWDVSKGQREAPPVEGQCEQCGVDVLWDPEDPSTLTPQCAECGMVLCSKKCFREHGKCDGRR